MAEARFVEVAKFVPAIPPLSVVQVRLTLDEAETLVDILSHVGGPAIITRRRHSDSISKSLGELGIKSFYTGDTGPRADRDGSITFKKQRK